MRARARAGRAKACWSVGRGRGSNRGLSDEQGEAREPAAGTHGGLKSGGRGGRGGRGGESAGTGGYRGSGGNGGIGGIPGGLWAVARTRI